jgi:hypothetical protein
MTDSKALVDENLKLKKEIEFLTSKLERVKIWMEREVKEQTHKIAKAKATKLTSDTKQDFLNENFEEVVANRINSYF